MKDNALNFCKQNIYIIMHYDLLQNLLLAEAAVLFAVRSRLLNDRDRGVDIVLYGYAVRTAVGGG